MKDPRPINELDYKEEAKEEDEYLTRTGQPSMTGGEGSPIIFS